MKNLLKSFLLFSLLICFNNLKSQTYQWVSKGVSEGYDYGNGIVTDDSGNVYVGGQIEYAANFEGTIFNTNGKHDILVGKYNSNGSINWLKHAGGIGGDLAWGVGIDKFHNVIITGEFENTAGFDPGDSITVSGSNDIFLAKYGPTGNVLWLRRMGGYNDDKAKAVVVDPNGSIYITGYFSNNSSFGSYSVNSSGGNDVFIAKYSSSGTCQWVKKAGGSKEDRGRGITLDPSGNLYIVGTFSNSINFNGVNYNSASNNSAFIAKYDTSGNFKWVKTAGACCDTSRYNAVTCDASGNAYAIGYFNSAMTVGATTLNTKGSSDVVIVKYSPAGNVLWAKDEGGSYEDMGYHLNYNNKKNLLYVTGFYDFQADFGTVHLTSVGNRDAFLAAYDPNGNVQWARSAGGDKRDCGQAVAGDTLGNIYQAGFFNDYSDFDAIHVTGDTLADFFLAKSSPALSPQPTNASTALAASQLNCSDILLNWNSGNGNKRVVVAHEINSPDKYPTDGVVYFPNNSFGSGTNLGSGNYIVYNGTGNSVTITNLSSATEYSFSVFEYNGSDLTINYNTVQFASASYMVTSFNMNLSASQSTICTGNQTTLSVHGGVSYQWLPSNVLSSSTGSSVIATPAVTTTFTVEGINNSGCHSVEQIVVHVNSLPSVQFSNTTEVCVNSSPLLLNGVNHQGGIFSGTGVSSNLFDPMIAGTGTHILSYTYTNGNGCSASDTASVIVHSLPVISLTSFSDVCKNAQPFLLTGALPAGGLYSGSAVSSGEFDPALAAAGGNIITYTYTDNNGCLNTGSINLTVNPLPVAAMTSLAAVCQDAAAVLLAGGTPLGGTYFGTGVNADIFSPSAAGSGDHVITYTYTDSNNCTGMTSEIINVKALPSVSFSTVPAVCINSQPIILNGGIPSGGTYSGQGVSNDTFTPMVTGMGNFQLTYTYQDSAGCTNTALQTLIVNPLPVVTLSVPADVCGDGTWLQLNGGIPAGGVYDGQNVIDGLFNQVSTPGPCVISYSYIDSNGCANSTSETINIRAIPSVELGSDTVICTGSTIALDAGQGFVSYLWSNGDNTEITQVSSNIAAAINCIVKVVDAYSCTNSDTVVVTFDGCSGISSVNNDHSFGNIYPNPFSSNFRLYSDKEVNVKIYNMSGMLVEKLKCIGSVTAGQNLSPGVYVVDLISENQKESVRVVKME